MHRNIFSQILAGVTVASLLASPFAAFADDTGLESEASTQVEVEASSAPAVPAESAPTETVTEAVTLLESEKGVATVTPIQDSSSEDIAKSADSTEVAPQEAASTQESVTMEASKKSDRPSMIADRSDEGQPLTQGTTFRGGENKESVKFYTSQGDLYPASAFNGVVVNWKAVDLEETKKLYPWLEYLVDAKVNALGIYEILEIDEKKVLFLKEKDVKGAVQVFVGGKNTNLSGKFINKWSSKQCDNLENIDMENVVAPAFVNTTKTPYKNCHTIKDSSGETIGYTIKNADFYWFYAPVKQEDVAYKTFYLNPTTSFQVVVRDDTLDLAATASIPALETCDYYLDCEGKAEILTIHGEELLFTQPKMGGTPAVYFSQADSVLQAVFPQNPQRIKTSDFTYDSKNMIKPSWVSDEDRKDIAGYSEFKENDTVIGYGIRTKNGKWFYAPAGAATPLTPIVPATPIQSETFYTSNDNPFPVVMKDDGTVDVELSKKLLENRLSEITKEEDKKAAEAFIAYADAAAELLEIEGKTLLFIKTNDHTTKVFHKEAGTHLKDSFKHSVATAGTLPADADIAKAIAPTWIADADKVDITYFNAVNEGYTLLAKTGHWFYAPKKDPETTPFYTSNNNEFLVVLKDEMTVDLPASKKLLEKALPLIVNPEDKKLAEDFIANATEADVEIKKIHNQRILFVKVEAGTTKVFRDSKDPLFQNAFRNTKATKGTPVDADITKAIAPNWISDAEKSNITHFVAIGNDGYTLLTKTGHWFYTPKKPRSTGGSSGGSSSGGSSGSSGGGSAAVTTTPLTPKEVTPEVKGDEQVRNKVLFPSFAKSCEQAVLDLTDSRLVAYYADLQVQNAANVHRSLTRAEFLKLVLNAAQVDVSAESTPDYTDVTEAHTLTKYIAYATRAGIVSGMNGKFRPNDVITRAEAAKIFVNVAGIKPSLNIHTFADVDAASSLAGYIQAAYDNCLLNGRKTLGGETLLENGSRVYEPEAPITLAETAKVLYNIVH